MQPRSVIVALSVSCCVLVALLIACFVRMRHYETKYQGYVIQGPMVFDAGNKPLDVVIGKPFCAPKLTVKCNQTVTSPPP